MITNYTPSTNRYRWLVVSLLCLLASSCNPRGPLPSGEIAFIHAPCESGNTDVTLSTLPSAQTESILSDVNNPRGLAWSPSGQALGLIEGDGDHKGLFIVDIPTHTIRHELSGPILKFAWSPTGESIFYLDSDENLYARDLANHEDKLLADGISNFSLSPTGRWLGLSKRDSDYLNSFTFRVLDMKEGTLLATLDHNDIGMLGSNISTWSPTAQDVAVLFGSSASQASKLVIYNVQSDHLQIKSTVDANETYSDDKAKHFSSGFTDLAWSQNGQNLLVIRSETDARPGGEVIKFDAALAKPEHMPFGDQITHLAWQDNQWLLYVTTGVDNVCGKHLNGKLWLADMNTLRTQEIITDTIYTEEPAWRSH